MFRNSKIFEYKNRSTPCYLSVLLIISMILVFSFESIGILRKDANINKRIFEIENLPIDIVESQDTVKKDLRNNEIADSSLDYQTLKIKRMRDLVFSSYDPEEHKTSTNSELNYEKMDFINDLNIVIRSPDYNKSIGQIEDDAYSSLFDN